MMIYIVLGNNLKLLMIWWTQVTHSSFFIQRLFSLFLARPKLMFRLWCDYFSRYSEHFANKNPKSALCPTMIIICYHPKPNTLIILLCHCVWRIEYLAPYLCYYMLCNPPNRTFCTSNFVWVLDLYIKMSSGMLVSFSFCVFKYVNMFATLSLWFFFLASHSICIVQSSETANIKDMGIYVC